MILASDVSINLLVGDLDNQCIINCSNSHKFRVVDISGNRNRCLKCSLNGVYRNINKIKKSTIVCPMTINSNGSQACYNMIVLWIVSLTMQRIGLSQ